jgi:hypothetical protein
MTLVYHMSGRSNVKKHAHEGLDPKMIVPEIVLAAAQQTNTVTSSRQVTK